MDHLNQIGNSVFLIAAIALGSTLNHPRKGFTQQIVISFRHKSTILLTVQHWKLS